MDINLLLLLALLLHLTLSVYILLIHLLLSLMIGLLLLLLLLHLLSHQHLLLHIILLRRRPDSRGRSILLLRRHLLPIPAIRLARPIHVALIPPILRQLLRRKIRLLLPALIVALRRTLPVRLEIIRRVRHVLLLLLLLLRLLLLGVPLAGKGLARAPICHCSEGVCIRL